MERNPMSSCGMMLMLVLLGAAPLQAFFSLEKEPEHPKPKSKVDTNRIHTPPPPKSNRMLDYGVDVSFPMHHDRVSENYEWLPHNTGETATTPRNLQDTVKQPLGNRQEFYDHFLDSCMKSFKNRASRCTQNERERIAMSLRQPQSMTNYTDVGYKKIRAPAKIWKLIQEFWRKNHNTMKEEKWGIGNTYTNNWESPSYMISVEDSTLRGGGYKLKQQIWNAAEETISEWTGQQLTQCSLYGVRVYTEGAVLATHVDRLPLVSSAIINVAQDVDEPWPLEVYGHDGKATNVTMEPGDMVLYESHSVLHGRPFPLKGRYMANIFIHFEPTGHSIRHNAKMEKTHGKDVNKKYKEALSRGAGGHEVDEGKKSDLPPYIIPGTPEEKNWRRFHPHGRKSRPRSFQTGSTNAHTAAQNGDLEGVKKAVKKDKSVVHAKDSNGWQPLHEAARGGHKDIVQFLYESGADINARTNNGTGGSVLWWTKKELGKEHEMVSYLESLGAMDAGPEL